MNEKTNFNVEYLDEVVTFLKSIDIKATKKILQVIDIASKTNDPKRFKKLENSNIWEFRAEVNKLQYRLFAFWDITRKSLVIATHGIIKKTQKTPQKEIDKAERIRAQFINEKRGIE